MKPSRIAPWALVILAALAAPFAHAGDTGISLGNVSAGTKGRVIVPFMLELANEDVRVGHITATVSYDDTVATFQNAEKGFLLDGVGGKITVTPKPDGAKSTISVDVITEGNPRQPLRKGLVLSLVFKVNEKAKPDTVMPLTLSGVSLATPDTEPKELQSLNLTPGEIHVLAPENVPFVSCFFFTH